MASHSCTLILPTQLLSLLSWIEACWYIVRRPGYKKIPIKEPVKVTNNNVNIAEKDHFIKQNQTPNSGPHGPFPQLTKINELLVIMWYNLIERA